MRVLLATEEKSWVLMREERGGLVFEAIVKVVRRGFACGGLWLRGLVVRGLLRTGRN